MKTLKLSALDTLFFKDGKPFDMGDDSSAAGLFPPPPSVFYGALRTTYMLEQTEKVFDDVLPESEKIEIKALNLLHKGEILYPCPADILVLEPAKKDDPKRVKRLVLKDNKAELGNFPTSRRLQDDSKDSEKVKGGTNFLTRAGLETYLNGGTPDSNDICSMGDLTTSEEKIGIGRDNHSGSVEEGKLYRLQYTRTLSKEKTQLSFQVGFEDGDLGWSPQESGLLKLGAEGKLARYDSQNFTPSPQISAEKLTRGTVFGLMLLTPAVFQQGWLPEGWNTESEFKIHEKPVKLLTAALGKPEYLGGWDLQNNRPKPMLRAVPAGSVYYFELQEDADQNWLDQLEGTGLSDVSREGLPELAKEGFGLCKVLLENKQNHKK